MNLKQRIQAASPLLIYRLHNGINGPICDAMAISIRFSVTTLVFQNMSAKVSLPPPFDDMVKDRVLETIDDLSG